MKNPATGMSRVNSKVRIEILRAPRARTRARALSSRGWISCPYMTSRLKKTNKGPEKAIKILLIKQLLRVIIWPSSASRERHRLHSDNSRKCLRERAACRSGSSLRGRIRRESKKALSLKQGLVATSIPLSHQPRSTVLISAITRNNHHISTVQI